MSVPEVIVQPLPTDLRFRNRENEYFHLFKRAFQITQDASLKIDKRLDDIIKDLSVVLESMSKEQAAELQAKIEAFVKQMEKQKKASGLQKFLKVLGVIMIVLAAVSTMVAPSPATIMMLITSLVMVLEPIISNAAGQKSFIEQGMKELVSSLSKAFGATTGAIFAAILIAVVALALSFFVPALVARCAASMGHSASNSLSKGLCEFLKGWFKAPSPQAQAKIFTFFNTAEAAVTFASGGIQFDLAVVRREIDKLIRDGHINQAQADFLNSIISTVTEDMNAFHKKRISSYPEYSNWILA